MHDGATNSGTQELSVWRVETRPVDVVTDRSEHALSGDDLERVDRIRAPIGRARFKVARSALRVILARYTGWPPEKIPIQYSPNGKPELAPQCVGPAFSVTHTGELVLVAIWPNGVVGIDAERMREVPRLDRITRRLFAAPVARRLGSLPDEEKRLAFFHAWTQREAYVKAVGGTMYRTVDPLPLVWPPDASPQRLRIQGTTHERVWTLYTMRPASGFVASIVASGEVGRLRVLEYPADLPLIDEAEPDGPAA